MDEAAKFGFLVGSAGFTGFYADWNAFYYDQRQHTQTYMQTANPQFQNLPSILQNARGLGIQLYELYPDDYQVAYYPTSTDSSTLSKALKAALDASRLHARSIRAGEVDGGRKPRRGRR